MPEPSFPYLPKAAWNYLLMVVLLLPSLVWIAQDHKVWPWDQAWYGEVSVDLWFWLGNSLRQWVSEMANGLPIKPPGIVWLGQFFVPLRGIFGSTEVALLLSVLATQFALLVILFKIGQHMAPQSQLVPGLGILLAASSQLFVGLSHEFFVEPLQAVAVAWCFYAVLRSPDWSKIRLLVHIGSALILGALAKATTPLYCLVPCAYCTYLLVRKGPKVIFLRDFSSKSLRALVLIVGPLGIAGGLWYRRNLTRVWQHVRDASYGDFALNYGSRDTVFHKLIIWSRLLNPSFLDPYMSWGWAIIVLFYGLTLYGRINSKDLLRVRPVALVSMLQIGLLLFIFSLNIQVDSRFMYALLPCVVIVLMQICVFVPNRVLFALIALACLQWAVVNKYSFEPNYHVVQSPWFPPLQADGSQYEELSRLVHLTSAPGDPNNIVAVEYPSLSANSANFFAAKERAKTGLHSNYMSIGYVPKDLNAAMRLVEAAKPAYLITLSEESQRFEEYQTQTPRYLNLISLPVLRFVRQDPRFTRYSFQSNNGLVVFQFASGSRMSDMGRIQSQWEGHVDFLLQ